MKAPTQREIDYGCALERQHREDKRTARRVVLLVCIAAVVFGCAWGLQ